MKQIVRQSLEVVVIVLLALVVREVILHHWLSAQATCWLVTLLAAGKTVYFLGENLHQLLEATSCNALYHRFMGLMLVNMTQIALSFGLDYWCLYAATHDTFSGIQEQLHGAELVFECCYLSFLNITYFGYGDITPQTIPAKLVTMMELLIAFFTVIFLLSDFISLKEGLRQEKK